MEYDLTLPSPGEIARKRKRAKSLDDDDDGFINTDDDDRDEDYWQDIDEVITGASSFRQGAPGTIRAQDRTLREFQGLMIKWYKREKREVLSRNRAENDAIIFNVNEQLLLRDISTYLVDALKNLQARSVRAQRPSITTIYKYRDHLLFWLREKRTQPFNYTKIHRELTKAIQHAAKTFWRPFIGMKRERKMFFGRHELRQLLDFESINSANRLNSEQHELAWSLACVCGIRPGSLAQAYLRPGQYLRYKDIRITRALGADGKYYIHSAARTLVMIDMSIGSPQEGLFDANVEFAFVKGRRDDETKMRARGNLTLTIKGSRQSSNIPLCPVLRFLALMLRRGALDRISTVDELLHGRQYQICIKPGFAELPIFVAGGYRGRNIDLHKAMSVSSLALFFHNRALMAGYRDGTTFYAWRNGAATSIQRATSRATARAVLDHEAGSKTYENHYENATYDVDVSAIAFGEESRSAEMAAQASEVLYRIEYDISPDCEEDFIRKFVSLDDNVRQAPPDKRSIAIWRSRVLARSAIREQLRLEQEKRMTIDDFQSRVAALNDPGLLFKKIQERARVKLTDRTVSKAASDAIDLEEVEEIQECIDLGERLGISFYDNEGQGQGQGQGQGEGNEEWLNTGERRAPVHESHQAPNLTAEINVDVENFSKEGQDIPFSLAVRCFLEIFTAEDNEIKPEEGSDALVCALCEVDPTVPDRDKKKSWTKPSMLLRHQHGNFHAGVSQWRRRMRIDCEPGDYRCPFDHCPKHFGYNKLPGLEEHLNNAARIDDEHGRIIRAAGWLDEEFRADRGDNIAGVVGERLQKMKQHRKNYNEKHPRWPKVIHWPIRKSISRLDTPNIVNSLGDSPLVLLGPNPIPEHVANSKKRNNPPTCHEGDIDTWLPPTSIVKFGFENSSMAFSQRFKVL